MQIDNNEKKIIGVCGNSGSGKTTFVNGFGEGRKIGIINYDIIKKNIVEEQIEYYVKKYKYRLKELDERKEEIIKMLDIDINILDKSVYEISESELSKVLIASVLLCNPDIIIFDEILDSFDSINKIKIIKLFIKLKKFFNKTIIIVSSNIDDIYEFIDEIIIIDDGKVLYFGDKYKVYNNYEKIKENNIRIPSIVTFIKKIRDEGINIDEVDSINELIKTIYREIR